MDTEAKLEKIGLSRQEAGVYLSALKLGMAKASEIAQKAEIKREASYYVLKMLQEKGFVSEAIKSGVKYYSAVEPKRILQIIEEEKQRKTTLIKEAIPELESFQKIAITHPKIEFFEGFEGLKTAASKLLERENQEIYCYIDERILKFIPYFHPQFRRRRKEKKVRLKVITRKTDFTIKDLKDKDNEELRETRFNDKLIRDLDSSYYILSDAIIILKANEKEQIGIYIKENTTARLQRRIFEEMWKKSEH
jgi:sugar-specific transcriptional regulator TrmB